MSDFFQKVSAAEILKRRGELKHQGKLLFSNFFGLYDDIHYEMAVSTQSLLVRHKEHDFYRLSAISIDLEDLQILLKELDGQTYVLNVPSKKDISEQIVFLEKCGFSLCGTYNRYYNKNIVRRECQDAEFANREDCEDIKKLLYETFSFYTDHLPNVDELQSMIENRQIVVNRFENGRVGGVAIHTIEDRCAYINVWIDKTGNGISLMFQTYNIIESKGISYAYLWIRANNTGVIVLHKMMGAKPDGLVDYTFVKDN